MCSQREPGSAGPWCRHHRSEAIRLTHTWQRGMHRAAAAFAVGDKAAASRIAQAARRKR